MKWKEIIWDILYNPDKIRDNSKFVQLKNNFKVEWIWACFYSQVYDGFMLEKPMYILIISKLLIVDLKGKSHLHK